MSQVDVNRIDYCPGCGQYIGKTLHACMGRQSSIIERSVQDYYKRESKSIADNIRRANAGLLVVTLLLALALPAHAQPLQQAYVLQPPRFVPVQGYWQPVPRPTWVGNRVLGPVWTFQIVQPPPQPLGPVQR